MSDELNPFQSPQATGGYAPIDVDTGITTTPRHPYATARTRAAWAITLVAMVMLVDLVGAGSTLMQIQLLERARVGNLPTQAEADANDQRQSMIALGYMAVFFTSAVTFLMWFHRVHRNLPALGAQRLQYTPGWAVGSFFVVHPVISG